MAVSSAQQPVTNLTTKLVSSALSLNRLSGICEMLKPIVEGFDARSCILWEISPNLPRRGNSTDKKKYEALYLRAQWPLNDKLPLKFDLPMNSISSQVAREQKRKNIIDLPHDQASYRHQFLEDLKAQTMCSVSVRFLDGNFGVLNLFRDRPAPLTEEEQVELESLAQLFPPLYQNVRDKVAFNLLQQVNTILYEAEYKNGSGAPSLEDVKKVLKQICVKVSETFQCLETSIFLGDRSEKSTTMNIPGGNLGEPVEIGLMATTFPDRHKFAKQSYRKGNNGLTAWVLTQAEALRIFDIEHADREIEELRKQRQDFAVMKNPALMDEFLRTFDLSDVREAPPCGFIGAPILSGPHVWGVIRCRGALVAPYQLPEGELKLLELVAAPIGLYWSNWLSRRELDRENRSLQQTVDGVNSMNMSVYAQLVGDKPDISILYDRTLEIISHVVESETVSDVRLFDTEKGELYLAHFRGNGWNTGSAEEIRARKMRRFPVNQTPPDSTGAEVFQTRKVIEVPDMHAKPYSPTSPEARHVIVAPIQVGDRFYGVLDVRGMKEHSFPKHIRPIVELFGLQLGLYSYLAENVNRLKKMENELKTTAKTNTQIFEDMKHQLRSPLIQGSSYLSSIAIEELEDTKLKSTLQAVRGLVKKAQRVALKMNLFAALANDKPLKLSLSSLPQNDLVKLLFEAAADHERFLADPYSNIHFSVERNTFRALRPFMVDRELLEQAVNNILDNAAKYSSPHTMVRISSGITGTGRYYISVLNKGIPLEPDEVKKCVQRGWRGGIAASSAGEGSGIGLWIVDHIMRAHGGELIMNPLKGSLTEVRLVFPAKGNSEEK
ncbi:MAG: hypothetical protein EXR78_07340 [Deltaproteobacteria bacterium]|nr:hypothetical protein [Deltaproteobacteria bacterium]